VVSVGGSVPELKLSVTTGITRSARAVAMKASVAPSITGKHNFGPGPGTSEFLLMAMKQQV
jgi:hypothetical protein